MMKTMQLAETASDEGYPISQAISIVIGNAAVIKDIKAIAEMYIDNLEKGIYPCVITIAHHAIAAPSA